MVDTVVTDHKPLESIFKNLANAPPPHIARMMLHILEYDVEIKYDPGKDILLADALSRISSCEDAKMQRWHNQRARCVYIGATYAYECKPNQSERNQGQNCQREHLVFPPRNHHPRMAWQEIRTSSTLACILELAWRINYLWWFNTQGHMHTHSKVLTTSCVETTTLCTPRCREMQA